MPSLLKPLGRSLATNLQRPTRPPSPKAATAWKRWTGGRAVGAPAGGRAKTSAASRRRTVETRYEARFCDMVELLRGMDLGRGGMPGEPVPYKDVAPNGKKRAPRAASRPNHTFAQ